MAKRTREFGVSHGFMPVEIPKPIAALGIELREDELKKRAKIVDTDGFIYQIPTDAKKSPVALEHCITTYNFVTSMLVKHYMSKLIGQEKVSSIVFNDDIKSKTNVVSYLNSISRYLRRIRRKSSMVIPISCRFTDGVNTVIFEIGAAEDGNDKPTNFIAILNINRKDISEIYCIDIDISNNTFMRYNNNTGFYVAPNKNKAMSLANENKAVTMVNLSSFHTKLVEKALEILEKTEATVHEDIEYTDEEMFLFRKIIDNHSKKYVTFAIEGYGTKPDDAGCEKFKHWNSSIPSEIHPDEDTSLWPLIDLSDKEYKFVEQYTEKHIGDVNVNLMKYIYGSRYGTNIKWPIKVSFPGEKDLVDLKLRVSILIDKDNDIMRFMLIDKVSEDICVVALVDVDGVSDFNFMNCTRSIRKDILYAGTDCMLSKVSDFYNISSLAKLGPNDIIELVARIIKLYIVIHDRPQRTRMIKCTERRMVKEKSNEAPKEKEFVVSRILKPVKEAKAYVDEMTKRAVGSRRPAEYTVEEWDRCGHTRQLKSGKVIWIEPTTCKRRLPLTEKEIHVKL